MKRRDFNARMLIGTASAAGLPVGLTACATTGEKPKGVTGVDTHAHVFHRSLPFVPGRRYTPTYDAPVERYLAVLQANAISNGVVIPISILGTNNDYTLEAIRINSGRLRGVAVVDPEKDIDRLKALAAGGIAGIRFNLIGKPVPELKTGAWRRLIDGCNALDWQVEVYDDAERLPFSLTPLLDLGANVVVDHFGKPDVKLGVEDPGFRYLLALGRTGKVWTRTSAEACSSIRR